MKRASAPCGKAVCRTAADPWTDSGVLANTPYTFKMRFENEKGTKLRSAKITTDAALV